MKFIFNRIRMVILGLTIATAGIISPKICIECLKKAAKDF